nr:hypothetical protein [Spirochaetaceae bacterium]
GKTGVDEQSSYMLKFANGAVAQLHSACNYQSPMNFIIYGSKGHMEIPGFNFPDRLILHIKGQKPEQILCPYESTGKNYEAQDVVNCLRQGQLESSIQSHDDPLKIMEIMDDLRRGKLSYPQELK